MKSQFAVPETKQSLPTRGINTSPTLWSEEKAEMDSQLWGTSKDHWILQNKVYDFTPFLRSHPGGPKWLELTKGQDITEHFISYHLNEDKARNTLSKYCIGEAKFTPEPRFTFAEDGLFRRVKRKLLETAPTKYWQDTSKSQRDGILLIIIWISIFVLAGLYDSTLLAILCGALIHSLTGVAHNFLHMKEHPFRYLWLTTGFSHLEQQQMHCLSHHSYPNTLIDFEIQALEPVLYYLQVSPKNHPFLWLFKEFMLLIAMPLNIIIKLIILPIMKWRLPEWWYLIPLMQLPLLYFITFNFNSALRLFLAIQLTYSFVSLKLNFFGHRTGQAWTEGNIEIRDFGQHQLEASSDTETKEVVGLLSYIVYAGFNYHGVHHMFPTIDNYQLGKATAILEKEANEMGLKMNKIGSFWEGIIAIERNFFSRKQWVKRKQN